MPKNVTLNYSLLLNFVDYFINCNSFGIKVKMQYNKGDLMILIKTYYTYECNGGRVFHFICMTPSSTSPCVIVPFVTI